MTGEWDRLIDTMVAASVSAARAAATCRDRGITGKQADAIANSAMLEVLSGLDGPRLVSEEVPETHGFDISRGDVLLLDPIDGTAAFDSGASNYANCVALLRDGAPIAGVICCPGERTLLLGDRPRHRVAEVSLTETFEPEGGWRACSPGPADPGNGVRALIGQADLTEATLGYLKSQDVTSLRLLDSAQCFLSLARREVDLVVKPGFSMEWDVAAGHAIAKALGGEMFDRRGRPMTYNKPGLRNDGFVAVIDKAIVKSPWS